MPTVICISYAFYMTKAVELEILWGGDKDSQKRDIKTAKGYWKERQSHG